MNVFWEIVGYVGTALVLISMMMTSVTRLRIVNMSGSVISMIYSFVAGAYPVVFLNLGLIIINTVQLIRAYKMKSGSEIGKGETEIQ